METNDNDNEKQVPVQIKDNWTLCEVCKSWRAAGIAARNEIDVLREENTKLRALVEAGLEGREK